VTLLQRQPASLGGRAAVAEGPEQELISRATALPAALDEAFARFATDEALAAIFELVGATNRYLERTAPWKRTHDPDRVRTVLAHAREAVRITAVALAPFLPGTSEAITAQLGERPPAAGAWHETLGWRENALGEQPAPPGGPVLFAKT